MPAARYEELARSFPRHDNRGSIEVVDRILAWYHALPSDIDDLKLIKALVRFGQTAPWVQFVTPMMDLR